MFQNVTIIIPSYNRHRQLERLLDYYSNYRISIIVGDSTLKPFTSLRKYKNVKYLHYPNYSYANKIPLIYNKVKTKYVIFCGDDDFVTPSGIKKSVEFLEKNPDYNSAHGHYIFFEERKNEISAYPFYLHSIDMDINSSIPSERLNRLLSNYMQLMYAVTKTADAIKAFDILDNHKQIKNDNLVELLQAAILCINGKSKILPIFYCAREITPNSARTHTAPLEVISTKHQFRKEYKIWLNAIMEHLVKKEKLSNGQAEKKVMEGINNYLKGLIIKLPFVNIYTLEIQRFIIRATFGLAKKLRNFIIKPNDYKNLPKHTFHTPLGESEFKKIQEYIKKYRVNIT